MERLELSRAKAPDSKSGAYADFATPAIYNKQRQSRRQKEFNYQSKRLKFMVLSGVSLFGCLLYLSSRIMRLTILPILSGSLVFWRVCRFSGSPCDGESL